ncbi:hypothetical protein BDN72DRAFT_844961 [Pluteus cervinus]|uniref:Uncharacterized protein n=1 Tax=Pluteus cervinus TaxID=181527 RepID=A0ACD3AKC8_9AGAR|nr:hypothetical protein BDN72DRAFT_844961 [Pluteus cervinus]
MATFAKTTFNSTIYSATRPSYPQRLFEYIYAYHNKKGSRWEHAVDVGCGTGQATKPLADRFSRVTAVDPSKSMLISAREYLGSSKPSVAFSFVQGSAEDLAAGIPQSQSVDLAIAAQAAHWFDWSKVWPELSRTLRPNGTAAFWIYSEFRLPEYPTLTPLITAYAQGTDPVTSVGSYFQRPGRTILENLLRDVPHPKSIVQDQFVDFRRVYFTGPHFDPSATATNGSSPQLQDNWEHHPTLLSQRMTWLDLLGYFRSWSALHTYHEKYPEDCLRTDSRFPEDDELLNNLDDHAGGLIVTEDTKTGHHTQESTLTKAELKELIDQYQPNRGDIAVRFWKDLREGVKEVAREDKPGYGIGLLDYVDIEWPVVLLLARRA